MKPIIETPLYVAYQITTSGQTIPTPTNSAGLVYNIPVTSGAATHSWDFQIDGTSVFKVKGVGNGAGGATSFQNIVGLGTAALPSLAETSGLTGMYFPTGSSIGFSLAGVQRAGFDSNGNFVLMGGAATSQSNIQFQTAASNLYDTNILHFSSTAMTMGMIGGSNPVFGGANGPFVGLRGNTYTAVATRRGNLILGAGNPSAPATGEGEIQFTTGADIFRLVIDKSGVIYIPTPSTNRFVVGGTAALGAGGSMATIIGNASGVGVLALQNTTAANAGYAQVDLYNSSSANVAGFGYGNSATVAATQDRTYFYTVAKDFHISTDSNGTRHFVVAATTGITTMSSRFNTKQGTDVASASTLTLGNGGNVFELTGTTAVNLITSTGWQNGSEIVLVANENVTINNGTATSGSNITIKLAGAANFAMTADDTLKLVLSETTAGSQAWREVCRSAN